MEDNGGVKIWGIHTKNESLFLRDSIIAVGWEKTGDLGSLPDDREAFKTRFQEAYPDRTKQSAATNGGMLYKFTREMSAGDYIVFYSRSDRKVNIGTICGGYVFAQGNAEYPHQRKVAWKKHIDRTAFSQGAMYELGSLMPVFLIRNYADEFIAALDKNFKAYTSETEDEPDNILTYTESIEENTKDYILRELSRKLKGYPLEQFVAGLLEAMGYRAVVSPQGGDSGIDITAYKDELPPRILVQVKSVDNMIRESTIQSLKGAMREGDYGLFVTLSGFTKNAQKYLEATPIIKGLNGTQFAELVMRYYDRLEPKWQEIVPMKRVYVPNITELEE